MGVRGMGVRGMGVRGMGVRGMGVRGMGLRGEAPTFRRGIGPFRRGSDRKMAMHPRQNDPRPRQNQLGRLD